ncbi:MAG: hypothetical protein NC200_04415 [Candidatus Gastranaerophilales bacterium]|nr:hypothetical protein [Candidatus Gastranaerophilales bacterium]
MDNEYISIKDFAELAGVSQQSIYQRIKKPHNPIQVYLKEVEGKTLIRKTALKDLYTKESKQEEAKEPIERILDILENQLAEKDKQIQEKDKQIESLLKSLDDTQRLLDQQQQLKAMETKLLIDKQDTQAENEEQKQDNKKGFFSRFFS